MNKALSNIASVSTGYCPHCRTVVNLAETIKLEIGCDRDKETDTITIRTYHCETCHSFVFSEREEHGYSVSLESEKAKNENRI